MSGHGAKPRWALIGVGTMFAATVISGFFLGYWVDVWLASSPLFMLVFGLLGLIGGILRVYRLLTRMAP